MIIFVCTCPVTILQILGCVAYGQNVSLSQTISQDDLKRKLGVPSPRVWLANSKSRRRRQRSLICSPSRGKWHSKRYGLSWHIMCKFWNLVQYRISVHHSVKSRCLKLQVLWSFQLVGDNVYRYLILMPSSGCYNWERTIQEGKISSSSVWQDWDLTVAQGDLKSCQVTSFCLQYSSEWPENLQNFKKNRVTQAQIPKVHIVKVCMTVPTVQSDRTI